MDNIFLFKEDKMKQRYLLLIILTVFLVGLSGVYNVQATEKLAKEQILHIAFDAGDAKTLDPHRAATTVDRSTVDPIFSGLVRYPPRKSGKC